MSTTLLPPNYYVVKPRGQPARLYATVGEAAVALRLLAGSPATGTALTGSRPRSLTDPEQRELGRRVRALRLQASATASAAHPLTTPSGTSCATRAASPARSTTATTRSTSL